MYTHTYSYYTYDTYTYVCTYVYTHVYLHMYIDTYAHDIPMYIGDLTFSLVTVIHLTSLFYSTPMIARRHPICATNFTSVITSQYTRPVASPSLLSFRLHRCLHVISRPRRDCCCCCRRHRRGSSEKV